ncbi:hypothetical protein [Bacteroides mediterraneensis]|uniref:hypothetical protein n=1 Tax=Bacteroides mediterraneensis TaxID=1841856 RepID=UPI0026EBEACA|nr:hypothetical protein [Bacteroides mediterraneensis]
MKKHLAIKILLLIILCLSTLSMTNASSFVVGRIYMKNGSVIECTEKDRIKLPKRLGDAVFLRNAYRKNEVRERFKADQIDSIIAWNPATPEHIRKFVPSESLGWLWIYFETPQISVGVYSAKGYGIGTNGGILILQRRRLLFHSKTAYCLKKAGDDDFVAVGKAAGKANNTFREKVAEYVSDDPDMADAILHSKTRRDKTLLMLENYKPGE